MLTIDAYFDTIAKHTDDDAFIVCGLGISTDEWWARTHRRDTFFVNGAMGYAGSVGLGLAIAVPDRKVVILDSDGGVTMNASGMITEASRQPTNVVHLILNNQSYGVLNSAPIANGTVTDYARMAQAAGIQQAIRVDDAEQFDSTLINAMAGNRFTYVEAMVERKKSPELGFEPPLPMPYEGPEMKYVFCRTLEEKTGRRVFNPQGF